MSQITKDKMNKQTTSTVLMIRPLSLKENKEKQKNDNLQKKIDIPQNKISEKALEEFDALVDKLKKEKIEVIVVEDKTKNLPSSVAINSWISFHENGNVGIYPMMEKNRRGERREDILDVLEEKGFEIKNELDYTLAQEEGLFLEGMDSVVLDRENEVAYCALSQRADEDLFIEFCEDFEFTPVVFHAYQSQGMKRVPLDNTNLMISVGQKVAVVCIGCIDSTKEQKVLLDFLRESKKTIITITEDQVNNFVANMVELKSTDGKSYMVMSSRAYASLTPEQIEQIEKNSQIIHSDLTTIENVAGISAKSMIAEVFLQRNQQ